MGASARRTYTFGAFRLDPDERVLFHAGRPVPLTPKAIDLLVALVERHGHLVAKEELLRIVWPDTFVEENNLTQNISILRRVLGEGPDGRHFIETVPKRGYRFLADVVELTNGTGAPNVVVDALQASPSERAGELPAVRVPVGRRIGRAAVWLLGATLLATLAYPFIRGWTARSVQPVASFDRIELTRITNSGSATSAHVSPDGRYIVHVLDEDAGHSLWLRQVASGTSNRLVPPRDVEYWGITFSPDGQDIYYVAWEPNKPDATLFRIPTAGGAPAPVPHARGIGTAVAFARDGSRIAYVADSSGTSDTQLVVSRRDGSDVRSLAARRKPDGFSQYRASAAWSPDGSVVACAAGAPGTGGARKNIVTIRLSDGAEKILGASTWNEVGRVAWTPDGSGLLITASTDRWTPQQIWFVSYPDGSARRITNDLNQYSDVSVTDDGRTVVAIQTSSVGALWVVTPEATRRLVTEAERYAGIEGMSWTPDGNLLYRSKASGTWDIWMIDPERREPRRITSDPHSELHPALSDTRVLTFASDRTGRFHLWTVPLDAPQSRPVQLTKGADEEVYPQVSADGRWVVYQKGFAWFEPLSIWRVPLAGGVPDQVAGPTSLRPALSPDGQLVAYFVLDRKQWMIAVVRLADGEPITRFEIPPTASRTLRWTSDGTAVAYIDSSQGVSNVWRQPLRGGARSRVTDFHSERIFDFAWSRDGKRLALSRGVEPNDVVVIRDSSPGS